jgi:S1-C subfamily serine protease
MILKKINQIFLLCFVMLLAGCSAQVVNEPTLINQIRPDPAGVSELNLEITKAQLEKALEVSRGSANLRIVPLVTSAAQAPATPEYRVFNIKQNGIGHLLGMKNADILVSAHGYVIQSPVQFYKYLQLLRGQESTEIEIRRDTKPIKIKIKFI